MVDWGPSNNFFSRNSPDPENTVRTVGAGTKRATNNKNSVSRVQVVNSAQKDALTRYKRNI